MIKLAVAGRLPKGLTPQLEVATKLVDEAVAGPDGIINLKLVDDAAIQALNKDYSGNDYATDVLSFSYIEDGQLEGEELGDIAISLPAAERQADEAGTDLATELTLLYIHGLLHVLGHDHQDEAARSQMDQLQAGLMKQLNLTYRDFAWTS